MGDINQLMADLFNGFSPSDLPLFFIQLLTPIMLAWILVRVSRSSDIPSDFVLYPLVVAFAVILSKQSVPLSVSAAGVFLLLLPRLKMFYEKAENPHVVIFSLLAGWSCGAGFVAVTLLVYLVVILPVCLFMRKK